MEMDLSQLEMTSDRVSSCEVPFDKVAILSCLWHPQVSVIWQISRPRCTDTVGFVVVC